MSEQESLATEGLRVLLIDDDESEYYLQQTALEKMGVDLRWAANLELGHEELRKHPVEAVVLDLNLTLTRGVETVRAFRALQQDVPLVVLSGHNEIALAQQALRADAQDYLVKGEEGWRIFRSIEHAIERQMFQSSLRDAFHSSEHGIVIATPGRDILFANKAAAKLFDSPLCEVDLSPGSRQLGNGISLHVRVSQTRWNGLPAELISLREEKPEQQIRLMEAQRMETLGRITGGVASKLDGLLSEIADQTEDSKSANLAKSAELLNRQLITLAAMAPSRRPLEFHQLVDQTVFLARPTIAAGVNIETNFPSKAATVQADRGELQHLILNLISNAADSLGDRGTLKLSTQTCTEHVALTIEDSGGGVPERLAQRIFEPYFTTKPNRLGLGLTTALGIVTSHGGTLHLETVSPQGARFQVSIPLSSETQLPTEHEALPAGRLQLEGTVLVIDDEALVTASLTRSLRRSGLQVEAYTDPREAIDFYRRFYHQVDLVILDIMMPGLSGADCLAELRELNPELRVLVSSGFYNAEVASLKATELLYKPYSTVNLLEAVKRTLE